MIQRVYEQAIQAPSLSKVVVATDDERIFSHVRTFGAEAIMTSEQHPSGTDRCFEALRKSGGSFDYVINIQGDEPFIDPSQIESLTSLLHDGSVELATLMIPVDNAEILFDMGEVKIVMNDKMEALYFSRMVIPFIKNVERSEWQKHYQYYRHVGMYAYRKDILGAICGLKPSSLEKAESLEQLRWLENGYKIKLGITQHESHCIDTPEDVEKVLKLIENGK